MYTNVHSTCICMCMCLAKQNNHRLFFGCVARCLLGCFLYGFPYVCGDIWSQCVEGFSTCLKACLAFTVLLDGFHSLPFQTVLFPHRLFVLFTLFHTGFNWLQWFLSFQIISILFSELLPDSMFCFPDRAFEQATKQVCECLNWAKCVCMCMWKCVCVGVCLCVCGCMYVYKHVCALVRCNELCICALFVVCRILYLVHCLLHAAYCRLYIVTLCCISHTVYLAL